MKILPFLLLLCACSTVTPVKLQVPPEPNYPKVSGKDMQCLSDDTYSKIIKRDRMKSAHIKTLEGIIRSTQDAH